MINSREYNGQNPFISCQNLVKIYKVADLEVVALQGLDLDVQPGEMMALVGASGSGKSTLLNVIGGLDAPSAGQVVVGGYDLLKTSHRHRVQYKRQVVGFVWQQPGRNLLPYLTSVENIEVPLGLTKMTAAQRRARSLELLDILGLTERANFRPDRLSGGEQQRVALAVALANRPPLLLADEPTGQLDSDAATQVFDALRRLNSAYGTTIVIVTHDPQVVARVDRVVGIRDGRTSTEIRRQRNSKNGDTEEEEWVILDQTGRLQLPQVYVDTLLMRGRVKVRLETDHVSVWPLSLDQDGVAVAQWRPEPRPDALVLGHESHSVEDRLPVVVTHDLCRTFVVGADEIHAVQDVNIEIPAGVLAVVKGRSGSGKTTLLNLVGGLDEPTTGTVLIEGQELARMAPSERIHLRRQQISFVFQTFGLMPFLSARENIEAPLRLLHLSAQERQKRADAALDLVGIADRANHRIHELSGGQMQRVAIARALVVYPRLLLADEPTGQLDTITGSNIIALLRQIAHELGITVVIASHDPKVEEAADLVYEMHDGLLRDPSQQTVATAETSVS